MFRDPEILCRIKECDGNTSIYDQPWSAFSKPEGSNNSCYSYKYVPYPGEESCSNKTFDTTELVPCEEWIYESGHTIVKEFGLACQEWKRTLVGTLHNVAMLISLPIIGLISDRSGRRMALTISAVTVSVFGILKSFASSYEMYMVCEILETLGGASTYPSAFVLILGIGLSFGGAALSLLDYLTEYWRTWARIAYPPSLLFVLYLFILPESIRWLMAKGRVDEAVNLIKRAAKSNKLNIPEATISKLIESKATPVVKHKNITDIKNENEDKHEIKENKKTEKNTMLLIEVIRSPAVLKRLIICAVWWATAIFVFYGLAVHSAAMPGNRHLNYALISFTEILGIIINTVTLNKVGRKPVLLSAFLICGVLCIAIPFLPKSLPWLTIMFYLLGKTAITMSVNGLYVYTSELFPTKARHSLLAFCSMTGRLGSILAPQLPLLAIYWESLPSILFGTFPILSALLMLLMPETLNTTLPDTFEEAENLDRKTKK